MARSRTFKAFILASGQFLTTCTGIVALAILSRMFSKAEYATYRQTLLAYKAVAPILILAMPQALYFFLPGETRRPRGVLLENLLLLGSMGAIFGLFIVCGGGDLLARRFHNPSLRETMPALAPYALFMLPMASLIPCLMSRDRVREITIYNVSSRVVALAIVLAAVFIWRTPLAAVLGTVIGAGILLIPALGLMLWSVGDGGGYPTLQGVARQVKYSVPLGLAGIIAMLGLALDKVVVSAMCAPEEFAIYSNGAVEVPVVGVVTGAVTSVIFPEIVALRKSGRAQEALDLWRRAAQKTSLIIVPTMCGLMFVAGDLMTAVFSGKYAASALAFRLYLLLLPLRIVTWGVPIMAAHRGGLILIKVIVGFSLNVALSIVLVWRMGYLGAILGTLLSIYLWNIPFNLAVIGKLYNTRLRRILPYGHLLKVLGLSVAGCAVFIPGAFIERQSELHSAIFLAITGPLYVVVVVALFVWTKLVDGKSILRVLRRTGRGSVR